tara:strand:- start:13519 stop:13977 length:459 start_codon:yes stop_codon:yes gene_type:complete
MSFFELLESLPKIFGSIGVLLLLITLIAFIFNFSVKFRLTGITIFSFLLSISSWAFIQSYSENINIEGAVYAPIVYDNGSDLIIAKADDNFPEESVNPTLEQISKNLKRGSRSGRNVVIRIRSLEKISEDISKPIILGEVEKSFITELPKDD